MLAGNKGKACNSLHQSCSHGTLTAALFQTQGSGRCKWVPEATWLLKEVKEGKRNRNPRFREKLSDMASHTGSPAPSVCVHQASSGDPGYHWLGATHAPWRLSHRCLQQPKQEKHSPFL